MGFEESSTACAGSVAGDHFDRNASTRFRKASGSSQNGRSGPGACFRPKVEEAAGSRGGCHPGRCVEGHCRIDKAPLAYGILSGPPGGYLG